MSHPRKLKAAPVGVVGKVLRILEVLDRAPGGLALKEIAEVTALNKSTAHRFVAHLEGAGYLFRDESKAYMIGPRLVRLGSGTNYQTTLTRISRPILNRIWKLSGETVSLALLEGRELVYVDIHEGIHAFRSATQVGTRRSLHSTAIGRAILSRMEPPVLEDFLRSIRTENRTPQSLASMAQLQRYLARSAQRGYILDEEEIAGTRAVAAAILDANNKVVGGISVSGPAVRMNPDRIPLFARFISLAAIEISRKLGYEGIVPQRPLALDDKSLRQMPNVQPIAVQMQPKELRPGL
jgi:DNA-binding IclR family transcriptional regulator